MLGSLKGVLLLSQNTDRRDWVNGLGKFSATARCSDRSVWKTSDKVACNSLNCTLPQANKHVPFLLIPDGISVSNAVPFLSGRKQFLDILVCRLNVSSWRRSNRLEVMPEKRSAQEKINEPNLTDPKVYSCPLSTLVDSGSSICFLNMRKWLVHETTHSLN